MNGAQKAILILGAIVTLAMLSFPPYQVVFESTVSSILGGGVDQVRVWRPVWSQPETGFHDAREFLPLAGRVHSSTIDTGTLLIEIIAAVIITGVSIALVKERRPQPAT